jgi:endonuclease III
MKPATKAALIMETLERLYPDPQVPLDHRDEYTLLIAVVLSAQATDRCVNTVTPGLFARASDARSMAALEASEIEAIIRPCGLAPRKAKSVRELSRLLVERHGGAVPANMDALEALPGVGHKTASVVMAQAFGEPAFPVDTHIHRLIRRWGLSSGRNVVETERDCKQLFPRDRWNKLHLQIIFFGREYCPARGHIPSACPLCSQLDAG